MGNRLLLHKDNLGPFETKKHTFGIKSTFKWLWKEKEMGHTVTAVSGYSLG